METRLQTLTMELAVEEVVDISLEVGEVVGELVVEAMMAEREETLERYRKSISFFSLGYILAFINLFDKSLKTILFLAGIH